MIRLDSISFRISGRTIFRNISLEIEEGETLGIMGLSGVGKSTLLKCMAGLMQPTTGKIYIKDTEITTLKESALNDVRKKVGMVFQYAALFDSMNVYENIAFGLRKHTKLKENEIADVVKEKLSIVGLPGVQEYLPSELSGGMQKRVGLARALAMNPEVLLYDEPTAGLDPITSAAISELINKTRDELGVTSVIVSHDVATLRSVCNRIGMMYGGKIVAVGSPKQLDQEKNPYVMQFLNGQVAGPIIISR